jgi:multiple sugar transport system substrate-binding protein
MSADPDNEDGAKDFLAYIGSPEACDAQSEAGYRSSGPTPSRPQRPEPGPAEGRGVHRRAGSIAQFLDRDTRPDFASTVDDSCPAGRSSRIPTTSTG